MHLTDYHAKYFAHELTKRCSSDSLEKLAGAVAGAQVDLNPHQVDAALFAFNSQRNEKRRSLFEAQDKVDQQRGELIASIEGKLVQNSFTSTLFTIRWKLH
jgi:hypothetical protein